MFSSKYKYSAVKVSAVTSQKTQEYAARMNENVIQPTRSKMQEGTLLTDISSSTKSWASKVASTTAKGWKDLTSALAETSNDKEEDDDTSRTTYQDMPLMTDSADKKRTTESSSLLDLDQSDTPLLHDGNPSPRSRDEDDDNWNNWANDDWDTNPPKKTPAVMEDEDGWEDWGDQNDLLIDFGDNKPVKSQTTASSSSKSNKAQKSSSQKITSLADTWDDAEGWDDAAWEEVEREVGTRKSSKAD